MRKFLILGHERSGSNLVVDALNAHPEVTCFNELFNADPNRKVFAQAFHGRAYEDGEDPVRFLDQAVYIDTNVLAVGFKLFYTQARERPASRLWTYLTERPEIFVIHLKRENLLDVFLSTKIAIRTGVWRVTEGQELPQTLPPFDVDPREAELYFNRLVAHRAWAEEQFRDHPILSVDYDELTRDFDSVARSLFAFLGVSDATPQVRMKKMSRGVVQDQIANYTGVYRRFQGSIHERHFPQPDWGGHPGRARSGDSLQ